MLHNGRQWMPPIAIGHLSDSVDLNKNEEEATKLWKRAKIADLPKFIPLFIIISTVKFKQIFSSSIKEVVKLQ